MNENVSSFEEQLLYYNFVTLYLMLQRSARDLRGKIIRFIVRADIPMEALGAHD